MTTCITCGGTGRLFCLTDTRQTHDCYICKGTGEDHRRTDLDYMQAQARRRQEARRSIRFQSNLIQLTRMGRRRDETERHG